MILQYPKKKSAKARKIMISTDSKYAENMLELDEMLKKKTVDNCRFAKDRQ